MKLKWRNRGGFPCAVGSRGLYMLAYSGVFPLGAVLHVEVLEKNRPGYQRIVTIGGGDEANLIQRAKVAAQEHEDR